MFLAPAFLFALFAIGVPLWLHRIARANPTRHPFASLMLLEASDAERTAKRSLRYWWLLLARLLLLLALVLAFAGPQFTQRFAGQPAAAGRLHAILLDTSLSMQYGDRWPRAMAAAQAVLEQAPASDRAMLVAGRGRQIEVLHPPVAVADAGGLRAAMRTLTPGLARLDYGLAMSTAEGWLDAAHRSEPQGTGSRDGLSMGRVGADLDQAPTVLHLITDLQRSAAPQRFADLQPPAQARLVLHDVGDGATGNLFIEQAALDPADARSLRVTIRAAAQPDSGPRPDDDSTAGPQVRQLILNVDGKEYARQEVSLTLAGTDRSNAPIGEGGAMRGELDHPATSLVVPLAPMGAADAAPAAGMAQVVFPSLELGPGAHRIELVLQPHDSLPQDDRYRAVIEHTDPRALLISRSPDADDAAYFSSALGSLTAPRLRIELQAGAGLSAAALASYSVLVITDAGALSSEDGVRIKEYVESGGTALVALGGESGAGGAAVDAQGSSRIAGGLLREGAGGLLEGIRLLAVHDGPARVGEITIAHPVLRESGEWHRVRFFRRYEVRVAEHDRVLIQYGDGSPLLVERTIGSGKMLLLAAPVDRNWNDLAIHPSFVRFIAEAARYLIGPGISASSTTVGSVVLTGLTADGGGQIFDSQGNRVLDLAQTRAAERLIPQQAGFYEIRGERGVRWVAVNVDARESDLARLSDSFVQRWQAMPLRKATLHAVSTDMDKPSNHESRTMSAAIALLWLAAGLLIAELLLANRHLAVRRETPQ